MMLETDYLKPETYLDDAKKLARIFEFKFDITEELSSPTALGEFNLRRFWGIERMFIKVLPSVTLDYEKFLSVFLHEMGHMLEIKLYNYNSNIELREQEMLATYFSMVTTTLLTGHISKQTLLQIITTTRLYGCSREHDDSVIEAVCECVDAFINVIAPNNSIPPIVVEMIIDTHRDILGRMFEETNGNVYEVVRFLAQ